MKDLAHLAVWLMTNEASLKVHAKGSLFTVSVTWKHITIARAGKVMIPLIEDLVVDMEKHIAHVKATPQLGRVD
jgi:hypothetical protein